ncbi:MAG: hypothetical protein CSA96_03935 [Bacteroidetes bacterium]|nr:MAG: hypothetical protein CSA96_03935 [Bacteroidota bacterium]
MTKRATNSILLFMLLLFAPARAQHRDFRPWFAYGLETRLEGGTWLSAEIGQRFRQNGLAYDRSLVTLKATRSLNSWLDASAGVRALMVRGRETGLHSRYRLQADLRAGQSWTDLRADLRLRAQYGFDSWSFVLHRGGNAFVIRTRLKCNYRIFGTRFGLKATVEPYFRLSASPNPGLSVLRLGSGLFYNTTARGRLSIDFMREAGLNRANPLRAYILQIGYRQRI